VIAALIAIAPVDIYYLLKYSAKITPEIKNWTADTFDSQRRLLENEGENICYEYRMQGDKLIITRSGIKGYVLLDIKPLKGYLSNAMSTSYVTEYLSAYYYKKTLLGYRYANVVTIDHVASRPKMYEIIISSSIVSPHPEKNYFIKNNLINL
jgi:hypothetical protein